MAAVNIKDLAKDTSFNNDDYIMKDGSTNGTRLISVQNAADDLARKSTVGLKRPSAYDEAITVDGADYIVKDDTSAPKRVTAQNAATSFAQLAQYGTSTSVSDQDYILKLGSTGVTKVEAEQAAADFAQLAGQVVGSEMVESAIAKGLADEALDRAIDTVVPNAVSQLKTELSAAEPSTEIVNGAIKSADETTTVDRNNQLIQWNPSTEEFKRTTVRNVLDGAVVNAPTDYTTTSGSTNGIYDVNDTYRVLVVYNGQVWRYRSRDFLNELYTRTSLDSSASSSGTPANDTYLLQVHDYSDGKYVRRIGKLDAYNNIANYVGEHIPFDKTNVDETTVDGQLRAALYNLGILDEVATAMLNLKKTLTKLAKQATPVRTEFTPKSGTADTSAGKCYYEVIGKLVHVHVALTGLPVNTQSALYTLPAGIRPRHRNTVIGVCGHIANSAFITLQTSGALAVYSQEDNVMGDMFYTL